MVTRRKQGGRGGDADDTFCFLCIFFLWRLADKIHLVLNLFTPHRSASHLMDFRGSTWPWSKGTTLILERQDFSMSSLISQSPTWSAPILAFFSPLWSHLLVLSHLIDSFKPHKPPWFLENIWSTPASEPLHLLFPLLASPGVLFPRISAWMLHDLSFSLSLFKCLYSDVLTILLKITTSSNAYYPPLLLYFSFKYLIASGILCILLDFSFFISCLFLLLAMWEQKSLPLILLYSWHLVEYLAQIRHSIINCWMNVWFSYAVIIDGLLPNCLGNFPSISAPLGPVLFF